MALRNAIPNPMEYVGQLRPNLGTEGLDEWFIAASFSIGGIATFVLMVMTLLSYAQLSFTNFVYTLRIPETLPVAGGALLFPFLTIVAGMLAVPLAFGIIDIADNREQLYDDANGMLLFSAVTLIVTGTQTAFEFSTLLESAMLTVGIIYIPLYLWRVTEERRRIG